MKNNRKLQVRKNSSVITGKKHFYLWEIEKTALADLLKIGVTIQRTSSILVGKPVSGILKANCSTRFSGREQNEEAFVPLHQTA